MARLESEAEANERIAADRLRIAREVHDVLAHTISAVTVQSAAALDAFDAGEPQRARESVERIRTLTRQASPEVRRAVEYLRGEEEPSRSPQPGLSQLDDLVAGARDAGLDVGFRLGADPERVSPVTALTAYRIVQEAVTNVVKHSDGTRIDIDVRSVTDRLVIDVVDDGTSHSGTASTGTADTGPIDDPGGGTVASSTSPTGGYGLRGMHERAAAVGGSATAGARAAGGFVVHAELPLTGAPEGVA
nr:histidine kinase [Planctomonas sp. JC2975]